jgi:hypothetical protein
MLCNRKRQAAPSCFSISTCSSRYGPRHDCGHVDTKPASIGAARGLHTCLHVCLQPRQHLFQVRVRVVSNQLEGDGHLHGASQQFFYELLAQSIAKPPQLSWVACPLARW